MEIINQRGKLTFAKRWKMQRVDIVLSNGIVRMFKVDACIAETYFPTCASTHVWHGHVNGGGEGFQVIFEDLLEIRAKTLIMCSFCNVSQSFVMYWWRWVWIYWWPFLSPHGTKYKHQKRKTKNACQVARSNELMGIQVNGISKARWTSTWKAYKYGVMNRGVVNLDGMNRWYL